MHVPGATNVTAVPETVQTGRVSDAKPTESPDDALADIVTGESFMFLLASAPKVMLCVALLAVVSLVTSAAGPYVPLPAWL